MGTVASFVYLYIYAHGKFVYSFPDLAICARSLYLFYYLAVSKRPSYINTVDLLFFTVCYMHTVNL